MTRLPKLLDQDRVVDAVLIPVLSVAQAVAMGIGAFATRDAFAALHTGVASETRMVATLLLSGLAVVLLAWAIKQRAEAMGQSYANAVRITLYRHLAGMDLTTLERRRVGALSLRFVGDLSAVRNWFGRGLPLAISAAFVLPGAALALWLLHPVLAHVALLTIGAFVLVTFGLAIGLERRHRRLRRKRANLSIAMIERIAVAPLLDLMGRTRTELRQLRAKGAQLREDAVDRAAVRNGLSGLVDAGAAVAGVVVIFVAGRDGIGAGLVAASLAMIAILAAPLRELASVWDRYCAWRVARGKMNDLFAQPSAPRAMSAVKGPVTVEIAGAVKARIAAGTTGCLPAGASVLRVIAGLDRSDDVEVRYGGRAKRPYLAYLADRPPILQGSLRRAATLGLRPRPDDDAIMDMLTAFGLGHLAEGPEGLRRRVAEGGRDLPPCARMRLELVSAALARVQLLLIEQGRLRVDPDMLGLVRGVDPAWLPTIIIGADAGAARAAA